MEFSTVVYGIRYDFIWEVWVCLVECSEAPVKPAHQGLFPWSCCHSGDLIYARCNLGEQKLSSSRHASCFQWWGLLAPLLPPWHHLQMLAQSKWGFCTKLCPWLICVAHVDMTLPMIYLWALQYLDICDITIVVPPEVLQDFHVNAFLIEVSSSSLWAPVVFKAVLLRQTFCYGSVCAVCFHRAASWILIFLP